VDEELKDAIAQLDRKVPPDVVINKLARSIRNRFLHRPCGALGEASPEDKVLFSRVLRRLFKLDDFQ